MRKTIEPNGLNIDAERQLQIDVIKKALGDVGLDLSAIRGWPGVDASESIVHSQLLVDLCTCIKRLCEGQDSTTWFDVEETLKKHKRHAFPCCGGNDEKPQAHCQDCPDRRK